MKRPATVLRAVVLVALLATAASAQVVPVPNGDFSSAANAGTVTGPLLNPNYTGALPGPWHASGTGVANLLLSPRSTITSAGNPIDGGAATISGLTDINVLGLGILNNTAEIYNLDIGSNFIAGATYRLEADFYSDTLLTNVSILTQGAFGIGLTGESGIRLADSLSASPAFVNLQILPDQHNGHISLLYTAVASDNGDDIGIRLFAGAGNNLVALSDLGMVRFDNVGLSIAAVPEPSSYALAGLGMMGLGLVWRRRRKTPGAPEEEASVDENEALEDEALEDARVC